MMLRIGLDFGTTNTAVAVLGAEQKVQLARFAHAAGVSDTFRSILYFRAGEKPLGGPRAIDAYLAAEVSMPATSTKSSSPAAAHSFPR